MKPLVDLYDNQNHPETKFQLLRIPMFETSFNECLFVVRYMSERASDQSKKINLQDLISKENLAKLVKSMEYETEKVKYKR